ncbi:hypothetical protein O1611_g2199 [Lasiodiplodia mahajangana]|uniref:Uncharacterized protein n=1 Tax=Lasiodiplodia mahajangana TaxID=1108764 RepID=A0ACC2JVX5_9PEZI|nr:hypothetical protein O1611_g2199 [Lasiodiplodia mahajangana]
MSNLSRRSTQTSLGPSKSRIPMPVAHDPASPASQFHTPLSLSPLWAKHAALRTDVTLTREEWFNVNRRIRKTVDTILSHGHTIRGPGPALEELHSNLGVALCAEILIRPIQRPCSLNDPLLQGKLRAMAKDPQHTGFRHTYLNGKVWFFFRIIDLEIAVQPLAGDTDDDYDTYEEF